MKNDYKALFQKGRIGNVELKNRIFKPAAEDSGSADGYISQYLVRFYAEEAKGGAGLIITGLNVVTPYELPGLERHAMIERDDRVPGFGELAEAIQDNGAKACCQLGHFGSHGTPVSPEWRRCVSREGLADGGEEWYTMFNMMYWGGKMTPEDFKEYSIDEIHELVGFYGDGALRAKQAGWDMVEIHGGHRHGLGCFLSPLTNRRTDEYGGSNEKRARILYEIVEDIQKKCGKDFPIIVRLNGTDGPGVLHDPRAAANGQTIEDTIEICKHLEEMGVAAVNISIQDTNVPMQTMKSGVAVDLAEQVKQHVNIPVMTAGSVKVPEYAEQILEEGKVDFVGTARQLYADPYWPNKALRGKRDEIRPCIRCMECVNNDRHSWYGPLCCTVNPTVGKENLYPVPADEKRKVAVIGGGPAGMEAARVLALKKHDVTLFEKRKLGGMLHEASTPDFKADIRDLITYYETQMKKLDINIVMKEATADDLADYDAIIVATGSNPVTLTIPGSDRENVITGLQALEGAEIKGNKVTVIGGGAVGVETAIWLAQHGKQVTVVEMLDQILNGEQIMNAVIDQEMIAQYHVQVMTGTSVKAINENSVTVAAKDGTESEIPTDTTVIAVGLRANNALYKQLDEESEAEVYDVGDCLKPRKIYDAIHEGFVAAMSL